MPEITSTNSYQGLQSALTSSVQGLQKASQKIADVAQDVAENGVVGLERNITDLLQAKTSFKANAAVIRSVDETQDRLLDIFV